MDKKIVIVGGGFAGSIIAKLLQDRFEVVLIDTKDFFEFIPGILKIVRDEKQIGRVRVKHREYLKKGKLVVGKVEGVGKDFVVVNNERIHFDVLVLASGAHYHFLSGVKDGVFSAYHSWEIEKSLHSLLDAKEIVVVGGGLVGVELAGELAEIFKGKIRLIQAHERLIPRNSKWAGFVAEKFLKKKGVEIVFNCRIKKRTSSGIVAEDGRAFNADVVFIATGLKPSSEFIEKGSLKRCLDKRKHIVVDKCLRVAGNVFAVGDVNSISEEKTAQNAERQANIVIRNILALFEGREMKEYKAVRIPVIISLGKRKGIFEYGNFVLSGWVPALLKWAVEKREILRRRFL